MPAGGFDAQIIISPSAPPEKSIENIHRENAIAKVAVYSAKPSKEGQHIIIGFSFIGKIHEGNVWALHQTCP